MSQLTRTEPQVPRFRLAPRVRLALAALIAGAVIALPLALTGNDDFTETPKTAGSRTGLDVRYDGGPEEGTRGVVSTSAPSDAAAVRYDGGPQEGTRGLGR